MSVSIIRQFYAYAGAGKFTEALSLFAPDAEIVFHGPASVPLSGTYRGTEEIKRFFSIVGAHLDVEVFTTDDFIDAGSKVVVTGRERSRVRVNDALFDVRWAQVWTLRDGQIISLVDFFDTGSMAEAFTQLSTATRG
jgi:ketosteroid isomerase-like protein